MGTTDWQQSIRRIPELFSMSSCQICHCPRPWFWWS